MTLDWLRAHAQEPAFSDRADAGRRLAGRLGDLVGQPDVLVLGLPRGGVAVAAEVARVLGAPLRAFLVRKLGAPANPELALGALASDGTLVVDRGLVRDLAVSEDYIEREIAAQTAELTARAARLGPWLALPELGDRVVVLVDDGVATGATVEAGLRALGQRGPASLVLAVPVAPPEVLARLARLADRVETVLAPKMVFGVGAWYGDFRQVADDEVARLLAEAERCSAPAAGPAAAP
jgi:predicted phosphoribosyltransferase